MSVSIRLGADFTTPHRVGCLASSRRRSAARQGPGLMASTLRTSCRLDTAHPCGSRIRHENETGSFATPVRQTRTPWSADRRSPRTLRPDTAADLRRRWPSLQCASLDRGNPPDRRSLRRPLSGTNVPDDLAPDSTEPGPLGYSRCRVSRTSLSNYLVDQSVEPLPYGHDLRRIPVTLHVRTCRICRMVRAFVPSGLEVNSAESDSAVRYRHGEFRSHMGRRVRCWSVVAPFYRGEHIQQRPAIVP